MKTTKSWKSILSPIETYFKQVDEVCDAMYRVKEQLRQIKSYAIGRYVLLLTLLIVMYVMVWLSGFVTWVAQEKTELRCWREVKAKNITPVFTCEKTLPRTGAH